MCATGMESVDDELTAVLRSHQNPTGASLSGVVTSSASALAGGAFLEQQHSFSSPERSVILGPGTIRRYSESANSKLSNDMPIQTLNPFQEQGTQSFVPSSMLSKNGTRRQSLWSTSGGSQRTFINGRSNGGLETDPRLQVPDYSTALLDHCPPPMPEPYRASGGLARYHSAPSSFLAGLADFHQDSALSSFFSDADLPPLNANSDSSLENMDTEQCTPLYEDKFLLNPRKFERIGNPQLVTGVGGLGNQKSLQSLYKHSMEVLHENPSGPSSLPSGSQIPSTSQMASSMCMPSSLVMPSSMGLSQQDSTQAGQQMNLGNLSGSLNFPCGLGSDFVGGASSGTLAGLSSSKSSGLVRQSSSPAGLLAQLSIDVQQAQLTQSNERQSLSSPQSPEDSLSGGTSEENVGTPGMMSTLDAGGWEDAANSYMNTWNNDFAARKRFRDNREMGDIVMPSETSGMASLEHGPPPGGLTRHMSLPNPKSKSSGLPEDSLQSVPCRIRAKRGCATHPRSIAERVRRTRITERIRKLQDLVPNMDKQQTNTADMLDEAVEYVKQLQRQVQELSESLAKCSSCCHQEHKNSGS